MCNLYSLKRATFRWVFLIMGLLLAQQLAANNVPLRDTLPPDITSFTPASAGRGQTVFIFGRHFTGATSVSFGGVPAVSFVAFADTGIRAVVGNGASGAVRVITPFGSDSQAGFRFIRDTLPPDITSFTPTSARRGETVFIFGSNLRGATSVSFGGVPAVSFVAFADTGIRAVVGNGASGAVRVSTRFGTDSLKGFKFIRDTLSPDITSFTPTSAGRGQTVFIFGSNLKGTTSVSFGGVPAVSFVAFADTGIRAVVGNGASGAVRVSTRFGADSLKGFTYIKDTIPGDTLCPVLENFFPKSGTTGTHVDIIGQNFFGTTSVSFGGVPAASFTVITDTLIYATVGNGASGAILVKKQFCSDSLGGFVFIRDSIPNDTLCPVIEFFSPKSGTTGTHVDIIGQNFFGTTSVSFGGVPAASFSVITDTLIYATVGNGASGAILVKKQICSDSLGGFVFIRDSIPNDTLCPVIEFFSPKSGTTGTHVDIIGQNFFGTTSVSFGGVPAASFTVITDSLIYATVGNGASGGVVVSKGFCRDSRGTFIYIRDTIPNDTLCPVIEFFSPKSGTTGTHVDIIGQNFFGTTSVSFGGVPAASFTVITDTLIYATVGNGASGAISVKKQFCTDSLSGFTFIRDSLPPDSSAPVIITFSPKKATTGTTVTILGDHFTGASFVSFGGIPAVTFQVLSDTIIRATVGRGRTGAVAVKTPRGWDSLGTFVYVPSDSIYTINISPNPARTYAIVSHPSFTSRTQLKLADISGNVVRIIQVAPSVKQTRLNLAGVRPGIYKLGWSNGDKWYSKTILVE